MFLSWILVLTNAVVCVAAIRYWIRTQKAGFAWFAIAFGLHAIYPILFPFIVRYVFGRYEVLLYSFQILFLLLVLGGLRSFFLQGLPDQETTDPRRVALSWAAIKRYAFVATGAILLVAGAVRMFGSLGQITRLPLADQNLGVGPVAIAVGLMCLWLAFHRRSPLLTPSDRTQTESSQT